MPSELIKKRAAVMLDVHPDKDALVQEMCDALNALREKRGKIDELIAEGEEVFVAVLNALKAGDAE